VRGLAAIDPYGLGVVDEHVIDCCRGFLAGGGNEAGFQARAGGRCEVCGKGDTRGGEGGFCYCVILGGGVSWVSCTCGRVYIP
jgi:hypothetical protein